MITFGATAIQGITINAQGEIVLTTAGGQFMADTSLVPKPPRTSALIIEDKDGNQWVIQPNGTVVAAPHGGLPPKYNYSDDKLDATDSLRVDFAEKLLPSPQLFGFDARRKGNTYFKWAKNFEAIRLKGGLPYFVPYQSLGALKDAPNTQTEQVVAYIKYSPKSGLDATKLVFRLKNSTSALVKTFVNDSTYLVSLPSVLLSTATSEPCVYAYYTQNGTPTTEKKIGKLNIIPLKKRIEKIVIVPVSGASLPFTVNALRDSLNNIYKQANVDFEVQIKPNFVFDLAKDSVAGLQRAGNGLNKYSAEMRVLRDEYMKIDTSKTAKYIFVVASFSGSGDIEGFMPRGRSMGFVASGADMRTYAHELGHGAFGLEHTFPEILKSSTQNLMDYSNGTNLTQKQWDIIEKDKFVFNWLDSEEDGSLQDIPRRGLPLKDNLYIGVKIVNGVSTNTTYQGVFSGSFYRSQSWAASTGQILHGGLDMTYSGGYYYWDTDPVPVYSTHQGRVMVSGDGTNTVYITNNSNNVRTVYAHMQRNLLVVNGQDIAMGEIIGYIGTEGTGNYHLHYELQYQYSTDLGIYSGRYGVFSQGIWKSIDLLPSEREIPNSVNMSGVNIPNPNVLRDLLLKPATPENITEIKTYIRTEPKAWYEP